MWRWVMCGAALALGGCPGTAPQSYKFRLTVEVETPQGPRTGSNVYEVEANNLSTVLPDAAKRDWHVKGDAVAIDLPGGKSLFALLKTSNPMRPDLAQMSMAALDPAFGNDLVESAARLARRTGVRTRAEVARRDFPLLVTFHDVGDPASVVPVDPDALDAQFGAGVRLKRIRVELTHDAVTKGIEHRLPWLGDRGRALDGDFAPTPTPTFAQTLKHSSFWQGPR